MKKNKFIVILTSPSHHLMSEPDDYIEAFTIEADTKENFNFEVEKLSRQFSLKYKVMLEKVQLLLTYKIKT